MKTTLLVFVLLIANASAQLPGDFNCNGDVNGVDITRYTSELRCCILNPIDSGSCYWQNGDVNSDGLNCTRADYLQLYWHFRGFELNDNPPQAGYLDTISVGNAIGSPGEEVYLPFYLSTVDTMGSVEINVRFENQYLHNPTLISGPEFRFSGLTPICDTNVIIFGYANDTLETGRQWIGNIRFDVDENTPIGEALRVNLDSDYYFPTGFVALSMPAYFVNPVLISGEVWVNPSGIDEPPLPGILSMNIFPNPFNSAANISIELADDSPLRLEILNLLGQIITIPINGYYQSGRYSVIWHSDGYSSGIYFCRLTTPKGAISRRMTLLK